MALRLEKGGWGAGGGGVHTADVNGGRDFISLKCVFMTLKILPRTKQTTVCRFAADGRFEVLFLEENRHAGTDSPLCVETKGLMSCNCI